MSACPSVYRLTNKFMIFLLFTLVRIGIDLGSYYTKSSIASTTDTPEIGMNYQTKRLTPTYIGFRASQGFDYHSESPLTTEEAKKLTPYFGDKALEIMSTKPWLGAGLLPLFLDLNASETSKLSRTLFVNSSAGRVSYSDLLALYMKLYIRCIAHNQQVTSVSVVVPATYSLMQRRLIETAVHGAGYSFLQTVDDVEAVANVYSVEKTNKYVNEPKTVLFVDVGATSIKAYAVNFSILIDEKTKKGRAQATRLSYAINNNNGGAFVTSKLVEKIKQKIGISKTTDAENRRIFEAAERMKLRLTLLKSASAQIEEIDGQDNDIEITRDEFEPLCEDLILNTMDVIKEASEGIEYDDIEIIGGSSRIPILQTRLQEELNITALGHSLNADEVLATGCGYSAQFYAGLSKYQRTIIIEKAPLMPANLYFDNQSLPICNETDCQEIIPINLTSNTFSVHVPSSKLRAGLITNFYSYKIDRLTNLTLHIRFRHPPIEVLSGKECNGSICTYMPIHPTRPLFAPSPIYITILKEEDTRGRLGKIRNEVEHFALRILDELENNQTIKDFTNSEQRFRINEVAVNVKHWIQNEVEDGDVDEKNFTKKLSELRDIISPVYIRIRENQTMTRSIQLMLTTLRLGYTAMLEWAVNRTYINKSEIDNFNTLMNETQKWFTEILNKTEGPLWEERKLKSTEVDQKSRKIYQEIMRIMAIKPPPKKSVLKSITNSTNGFFNRIKKNKFVKKISNLIFPPKPSVTKGKPATKKPPTKGAAKPKSTIPPKPSSVPKEPEQAPKEPAQNPEEPVKAPNTKAESTPEPIVESAEAKEETTTNKPVKSEL